MNMRTILALLAVAVLIPVLTGLFHLSMSVIRVAGGVVVIGCLVWIVVQQSRRK